MTTAIKFNKKSGSTISVTSIEGQEYKLELTTDGCIEISGNNFTTQKHKIKDLSSFPNPIGCHTTHYTICNPMEEYGEKTFPVSIGSGETEENTIKIDPKRKIFHVPETLLSPSSPWE